MKTTKLILAGLAATASLLSLSQAQSTVAVTDPVGYITIDLKAAGTLSFISPTLVNKVEFSGAVSSAAGTTVNLTGLTAGAYNKTAAVVDVKPAYFAYYVEVTSGPNAGVWSNIISNTGTSVVTEDDISSSATGNTVTVRKHVTIADFFGATNTAGLGASADISGADEIRLLDTATKEISKYFFYSEAGVTGWYTGEFMEATDVPIEPGQGVFINRKTGAASSFTRVGHVKTGATMTTYNPGLSVVSVPHATGTVLSTSNLSNAGPQSGSVVAGAEVAAADTISVQQANGSFLKYFFYSEGGVTSWVDAEFNDATSVTLKEGSSFLLVRKPVGTLTWTAPLQTITN